MDDKLENPKPRPGEPQKSYIDRCIPIVKKEHPDWPQKQVVAVCYSMWRRRHKNEMEMNGYELFTDSAQMILEKVPSNYTNVDKNIPTNNIKKLIAIYGNRFMAGGFFSAEELKRVYKNWEGTLHDINHMGTSTGFFLAQQDITYFIGYHNNVKYDENTKSVSMDLNIHKGTKFAAAWEAFVELCEMAGQTPNVSVTYYGKRKFVPVTDLPPEANWEAEGFNKDDLVPILYDVKPVCVSTVLRGRCDDKAGCGIRNTFSESGLEDSNSCDECEKQEKLEKELEQKRQELISWLKKNDTNSED